MTEATLLRAGARPILRFERHLPRPIDAVWRAVTDPAVMTAWFPTRIEIDEWKVGAGLIHHFDDQPIDPLPGAVVEWDPPRRVAFTWGTDTITFELAPAPGGGTTFVLTEELAANHAARNAAGWEVCLDRLERNDGSEHHNSEHGASDEPWQQRFDRYAAAFQPMLGDQEGPPEGVDTGQ